MFTNKAAATGLNDIAVFLTVVQAGSFTAAAERLDLSKSVVSKYVTRLEDRLGARLLVRTTRSLNLTEVGRVFYDRSREGMAAIVDAEEVVSVLQGEPRGTLRVASPMSFGVLHLTSSITDFTKRFADVDVDVSYDDRKVDVVGEGFDVALRITADLDPGLVARRIAPCRHVLVASPDYVERHGAPRTPGDLADHSVITYQYQQSPWQWEFRAPEAAPVSVSVDGRIRMNNSLAIREAVLAGTGITRTPTFVVGPDIQQGRLMPLLREYRQLELSIYLVYPQRQHLAPKVRAFVDFVADRFAGTPSWDEGL